MESKPNRNARALARMGASKGGKARASVLTPEERREIAQKAVRTRWAKAKGIPIEDVGGQVYTLPDQSLEKPDSTKSNVTQKPISWFQGRLDFGEGISISCHVLSDGKRVFAQREVVGAITGNIKGGLSRYLSANNLNGYFNEDISKKTVQFVVPGSSAEAIGYDATLLIEICDAYLKAREKGVLTATQIPLAKRAEIIMRSCAKVGVIALVDEATGYQKVREDNALRLKLQAFIAEDMQEWVRMFPPDFFQELARLENVRYSPRSRPIRWGKYVLAFVYAAVDKDVAKELKRRIPNPQHGRNLHQLLRDFGKEKVNAQLYQVIGIMKTCRDMDEFKQKFAYIFKKEPLQTTFFDLVDAYQVN